MKPEDIESTGEATYCPEDNKLRLYVGRVPRAEYEALRAEGWTSTPKQACDFVATWTPTREDTARAYGDGIIGDEDQSPADRAADRAERFAGYRANRIDDATQTAAKYSGDAIGMQDRERAERRAARVDRCADVALDYWRKAEYWQRRTAGVIAHALYKAEPGVRMGRIKRLETEQRRNDEGAQQASARWSAWTKVRELAGTDPEKAHKLAVIASSTSHDYDYKHPRPADGVPEHYTKTGTSLHTLLTMEKHPITAAEAAALYFGRYCEPLRPTGRLARWAEHYDLRLAYERQMLDAEGGRAGTLDIEPGGWLGKYQVQKVHKSTVTGRVVSVSVIAPDSQTHDRWGNQYEDLTKTRPPRLVNVEIERMQQSVYRAPTDEERAAFAKAKQDGPGAPPLINPTLEDAERLQAAWNAHAAKHGGEYCSKPNKVQQMTQEEYARAAKYGCGTYTKLVAGVRVRRRGVHWGADAVIVLTDKPQKALPASFWAEVDPIPEPTIEEKTEGALALGFPSLEACETHQRWLDDQKPKPQPAPAPAPTPEPEPTPEPWQLDPTPPSPSPDEERRKRREALAERAARPLAARAVDTTGDLFDAYKADAPLFASRTPQMVTT